MKRGVTVDWEVADSITLEVLKDLYEVTDKELSDYFQGNKWMHDEDLGNAFERRYALKVLIKYFGGP